MEEIHKSFENLLNDPKKFLKKNDKLINDTKELLKQTYDFCKSQEIKRIRSSALPALIVKDFDLEQIWQQIELQNDGLFTRTVTNVSRLLPKKEQLIFKNLQNVKVPKENEEGNQREEAAASEDNNSGEDSLASDQDDEDLQLDEEVDSEKDEENDSREVTLKPGKKSIVDDEFFKLDEMETFLIAEEKKLEEPDSGNDSEDDDDDDEENDEDIDLFEAESDDEDDPAKTARFKDFFVSHEENRKEKRNKFLEEMEDDNPETVKSSFELRQERLRQKIEEMEEEAVQEKPWQLKGEITAESRPQNSLLEEVLEFDMTSRPAPVITEQTTFQLEDIIKQRIKDKVFDSVQRKAKPVDTPLEYKKKLVLDQEKSKESLAQIYEKEYLEQKAALDPENADKPEEIPQLHQEINTIMYSLFQKLDALSNFHFTPKPATAELKIVSNLPAIAMEEIAPVASSEATLLAPQEVKRPIRDSIGKNERTTTDKKRERRKKKQKQRYHAQQKQKTQKDIGQVKNKSNKVQQEVVSVPKSSKAFFSQLEDQVKSQIKAKTAIKRKDESVNHLNAKKLKL